MYNEQVINHDLWVFENEQYIRQQNNGYLCHSAKSIFVVESQTLVWRAEKEISFQLVVSYRYLYGYTYTIKFN